MTPTATSYTLPDELSGCVGTTSTCKQNSINPSELNLWRVIKKNEDGTIDMISEYVSSTKIYFYGSTGYKNIIGALNIIADQYTNIKYIQSTRYIGYSNQIEKCSSNLTINGATDCGTDTGYEEDVKIMQFALGSLIAMDVLTKEPTGYWLSSRITDKNTGGSYCCNGCSSMCTVTSTNYERTYYGRVVSKTGSISNASFWTKAVSCSVCQSDNKNGVRPVVTTNADIQIISGDGKSAETAYRFE